MGYLENQRRVKGGAQRNEQKKWSINKQGQAEVEMSILGQG